MAEILPIQRKTLSSQSTIKIFFHLSTINVFGPLSFLVLFLCHSWIVHPFGEDTITDEELQILTYARHLWLLSREGFFRVPHLLGLEHQTFH